MKTVAKIVSRRQCCNTHMVQQVTIDRTHTTVLHTTRNILCTAKYSCNTGITAHIALSNFAPANLVAALTHEQ